MDQAEAEGLKGSEGAPKVKILKIFPVEDLSSREVTVSIVALCWIQLFQLTNGFTHDLFIKRTCCFQAGCCKTWINDTWYVFGCPSFRLVVELWM